MINTKQAENMEKEKVIVIGLDGATFDLLTPWMDEGRLPNLKKIRENGVSGELESVIPPITGPAWSSFMTGKNPGKHGVYYFFQDRGGGSINFVTNRSRLGTTLWKYLSDYGEKVVVLNVPTTYPPEEINGVMISDFLTPQGKRDFIYPTHLVDELEERFGEYPLHMKTPAFAPNLSESNVERFLHELNSNLAQKLETAAYLMDEIDPDFVMLHIWETDRIQHELWNLIDESHPRYHKDLSAKYKGKIIDFYVEMDKGLGDLIQKMGSDPSVFIISDHGFGPIHKCIDLNVWLLNEGYIKIKKGLGTKLRHLLWKLGFTNEFIFKILLKTIFKSRSKLLEKKPEDVVNVIQGVKNKLFFSFEDIDWSETKAYCRIGIGGINVNVKGREPHGTVEAGEEYEKVRASIKAGLQELQDDADGKKIDGKIYFREEIYSGDCIDGAPDIMYLSLDSGYLAGNAVGFTSNRVITDNLVWFGNHRTNGILLAEGKCLRQGEQIKEAGIIDLAPTILHLMGYGVPKDMDGRVLEEIFTPDFLEKNGIEYIDEIPPGERAEGDDGDDDMEDVVRRLKGLGYLT